MPLPSTPRVVETVTGPFSVLMVCSGNICRSPLAEALLLDRLAPLFEEGDLRVCSAGTIGLADAPMDELAAHEARRLGVDIDSHRGRRLSRSMVRGAHLVLGMTREHRARAVEFEPAAVGHAFTLLEFATVLSALEAPVVGEGMSDRLASVIAMAAVSRGAVTSASEAPLDIDDPYQRSAEVHRRIAEEVDRTVSVIVTELVRLAAR